jgi:hypothetical protein
MTTTNLGLATVPTNSTNPSVPVNDALNALDAAIAGTASRNLAANANYTLLPADYLASVLVITDTMPILTVGRDIIFPVHFPIIVVKNSTAQTLTLKKTGQPGVTLAAGGSGIYASGATDVIAAAGIGAITIAGITSVQTVASAATVTPVATNDEVIITAQAVGLTIANPSGTAASGQGFVIAIYSAAAQTIGFGTDYRGFDAALPTTTIAGKWMYLPVLRNHTDSKWDVLKASNQL